MAAKTEFFFLIDLTGSFKMFVALLLECTRTQNLTLEETLMLQINT